jgi:hypothetical protein
VFISSREGAIVVSILGFLSTVSSRGASVLVKLSTIVNIVRVLSIIIRVIEPLIA